MKTGKPVFYRRNKTRYLVVFLLCCPWILQAAPQVVIDEGFTYALVTPDVLRDPEQQLSIEDIVHQGASRPFTTVRTPYITFGNDPSNWWLQFDITNRTSADAIAVLRLNRKNFDSFELYSQDAHGKVSALGLVGGNMANTDSRFILTDGYHYNLVLPPGTTHLFCKASNRLGSMHLMLSLHHQEHFDTLMRRQVLLFGVFAGVMAVSILFSILLLLHYRERIYWLYLLYVLNILFREAYNYAADFGIMPVFQRNVTSLLIAASFGIFYRHFLKTWEIIPNTDRVIKAYIRFVLLSSAIVWILAGYAQGEVLKYFFRILDIANLGFTLLALSINIRYYQRSDRVRMTTWAFLPLGIGFVAILLRNMNLIPNYPVINYAVILGFIIEVVVFTIGFLYWHRDIATDRSMLQMKLTVEKQEKQIAIQAAEQRVKDRIARDLHDDVAASMSGIRILTQVTQRQIGQDASPTVVQLLNQISKGAENVSESISDLIWSIKPSSHYLNDMADRMREHASKVLEARNIQYRFDIARDLPIMELNLEAKRNIYLIFKEAVNNALKYSECRNVYIGFSLEYGQLILIVQDDGIGFDPAEATKGNGMRNLKKRAEEIAARLNVQSAPGRGTTIQVVYIPPHRHDG